MKLTHLVDVDGDGVVDFYVLTASDDNDTVDRVELELDEVADFAIDILQAASAHPSLKEALLQRLLGLDGEPRMFAHRVLSDAAEDLRLAIEDAQGEL